MIAAFFGATDASSGNLNAADYQSLRTYFGPVFGRTCRPRCTAPE
jgi:hypothetical protein